MADWERHDEAEPGRLDVDDVEVGVLTPDDLDWVTRIDEKHSGQSRREYFKVKLEEATQDTGVRISLAARIDGVPAGFLMGRVYYGEFGSPEASAILDTIGVAPEYRGRNVGKALMRQLMVNLHGLGVEHVRTEVEWDDTTLIGFFQRSGFRPASRLCLEVPVTYPTE
jgi:ribosomal protein S18 acetylase RimI-like enzyme